MNVGSILQKMALVVLEETGWKPPTAAGKPTAARRGAQPVAAKLVMGGRAAIVHTAPNGAGRKVYVPAQGLNKSIVAAQTGNNAKVLAVVFKAGRKKGLTMPEVAKASGVIPKTVESCLYQLRTAKLVESRAQ